MEIGLTIEKAIRTLLLTLCQLVYSMIVFFFNIFEKIGTASIVNDTYIMEVYERVGLILGLFMLFRITFSAIQYVINPDLLMDKKTGMGNIVKKAFIVIVLLGTTPYLFQLAFKVQNIIIDEDVLPKIIVGSTADTENFGINLAEYTFFNFYTRNPAAGDLCGENQYNAMMNTFHNSGDLSMTKNCIDLYDEDNEAWAINFDYHGLLPLIVGGVLLWMIVMYTLQVAVRAFQLAYLQLIAPIPIMLYLDPKKDDQLQKWFKQCTTTYLDFFIRVAIVYFVVFVIEIIMSKDFFNTIDVTGGSFFSNFYISVVLIIALLVFAKKVPDLFKELFPMGGGASKFDFGLSPKKVLNDTWAAGLIGGTVGALGAGASNAIHGYMNMRKAWNKNPIDGKLTKEQREALGEQGVADYNAKRRAQMSARFGATLGAAGKTALSVAGGVLGGAKAGLKTKDITKSGEAIKTANKNREERELRADAGYHWYNPLPAMEDKILGFAGESEDTIKNRNQALRDKAKRESDLAEGERLYYAYGEVKDPSTGERKLNPDKAFKHSSYVESYNELGAAKKEAKTAEITLSQEQANLNAAYNYTGENREEVIKTAQERYNIAYGNAKATQGKLELAKAKHDSNKKIFADDAKVEDLFKYYSDLNSPLASLESVTVKSKPSSEPQSPTVTADERSAFEKAKEEYRKQDEEVEKVQKELIEAIATEDDPEEVKKVQTKFKTQEQIRDEAGERMKELDPSYKNRSTINSLNDDEDAVDIYKMNTKDLKKHKEYLQKRLKNLNAEYQKLEHEQQFGIENNAAKFAPLNAEIQKVSTELAKVSALLDMDM